MFVHDLKNFSFSAEMASFELEMWWL